MTEALPPPPPPPAAGIAVYSSINSVMKLIQTKGISKDRQCESGSRFKYRGIDDVYNALCPLLAQCNLVIIPRVLSRTTQDKPTKTGGLSVYTVVEVEYDIVCSTDGSRHIARTIGEAMDSGDKSTAKAMSVAYKYLCFQLFAIPTEGDNDPDSQAEQFAARDKEADMERVRKADLFINGCMAQLGMAVLRDELLSAVNSIYNTARQLYDIHNSYVYIDQQLHRAFEILSNRFMEAVSISEVKALYSACQLMDKLSEGAHSFQTRGYNMSVDANARINAEKNAIDSTATVVSN